MAGDETLGILEEIQSLVYDALQVVSYKWLSRNFSLSSNDAKRLLEDFVEKYGKEVQVVYTISGWLKENPQDYHIRLVSSTKLSDARENFKENYSVQVYSIQASIPKDPAVLWSAEFTQAEGLFDQPPSVNNCLRDNRFCGISNVSVKRTFEGKTAAISPFPHKNGFGGNVSSRSNGAMPDVSRQNQVAKSAAQSSSDAISSQKTVSATPEINSENIKSNTNMERVPTSKTKVLKEKTLSASGGSLANIWSRTSAKIKASSPATVSTNDTVTLAPSHTCSRGVSDAVSSDDDECDINFKRETHAGSGRKRKVVFDLSDDEDGEDNIVRLASPEAPSKQLNCVQNAGNLVIKKGLANTEMENVDNVCRKQAKTANSSEQLVNDELVDSRINKNAGSSDPILEANVALGHHEKIEKNEATNQLPSLPKRKKVLNTRIDEKGREVTEVIWEGDVAEDCNALKDSSINDVEKRPPMPTKTATTTNITSGKTGNRKTGKGGVKDVKQGNILSFFKKI